MPIARRCRDEDQPALLRIINSAAQKYRGVIPDDRWHDPYMSADELAAEIAAGVEFWGAELDAALVGVMGIQQVLDVDLIRHAYVAPEVQGARHWRSSSGAIVRTQVASHPRRHLGSRDVGNRILSAPRLPPRRPRRDCNPVAKVLDGSGSADRNLRRFEEGVSRLLTAAGSWRGGYTRPIWRGRAPASRAADPASPATARWRSARGSRWSP